MLQSYSLPIKEIKYSEKDNSKVQVVYEDDSFNFTTPDDPVVLVWLHDNEILPYINVPSTRDAFLPEANLISPITGAPSFVPEEE
jgi:hypothetical protein